MPKSCTLLNPNHHLQNLDLALVSSLDVSWYIILWCFKDPIQGKWANLKVSSVEHNWAISTIIWLWNSCTLIHLVWKKISLIIWNLPTSMPLYKHSKHHHPIGISWIIHSSLLSPSIWRHRCLQTLKEAFQLASRDDNMKENLH